MCGIAGEIRFDETPADVDAVTTMTAALHRRGPDGWGSYAGGRTAFGHRRLKIIDLSDRAAQPMVDPELGLTVVFNGLIYNYRELRSELGAAGYRFFSHSDSEVLLKAYHRWGTSCVDHFLGMFAFAVLERDSGRLVALHHYLSFHSVVPAPRTILAGVEKLPPATVCTVHPDGRREDREYWRPTFSRGGPGVGLDTRDITDWPGAVLDALRLAVERRMVADVPVGVLLSGGIDSSLIVALLAESGQQQLRTFSVGFEAAGGESGDEFVYSDQVAAHFGTDHQKIMVKSDRLLPAVDAAIEAMSEPMVSHDCVAFYLLSKEVSRSVTVVQSGQGADEVFAGYDWYPPLASAPRDRAAAAYAEVFVDRPHAGLPALLEPEWLADCDFFTRDHSRAFIEMHFGAPGADTALDAALRLDTTIMLVDGSFLDRVRDAVTDPVAKDRGLFRPD